MTDDLLTIADATAAADPDVAAERARLVVYYEQGDGARTRILELPEGGEVTFGRSRTCTVHIDSEKVSRTHAKLVSRHGEITIEDLGSRNGTKVNGVRIEASTSLSSGDEVVVGPATAVVTITTRASRPTHVGTTAYLEERLAAEADRGLRYQRTFALLMVRLEGAQDEADAALERLVAQLRPMDVIAEYGPDEFAVLVPEADQTAAEEAAKRFEREVGSPACAIKAGVAVFPSHASQAGELLSRAHAALLSARTSKVSVVSAPAAEPLPGADDVIVGDPQMRRVYSLVNKVADTSMTVLIVGETGVGKEVVAEQLHRSSPRNDKPFLRLNCASIPETLLESELFGYERGAFTGADRRKQGYFEAADGGTIFLDEIGEISPGLQAKLLRVLEEHKFTRVGGTKELEVDVRVVCATNRDLEEEVRRGAFREDLFFRVSAFTVVVPPLRDRRAEIGLLAEHFMKSASASFAGINATISQPAMDALLRHAWPGNVRELRNAMERAIVLQDDGVIELEHLPDRVRLGGARPVTDGGGAPGSDVREKIAGVERDAIVAAMEACNGNQTHAARKLGLSRRALIYKLEKYGLKKPPANKR
jgi:DNA-binding NtrC family response regulator